MHGKGPEQCIAGCISSKELQQKTDRSVNKAKSTCDHARNPLFPVYKQEKEKKCETGRCTVELDRVEGERAVLEKLERQSVEEVLFGNGRAPAATFHVAADPCEEQAKGGAQGKGIRCAPEVQSLRNPGKEKKHQRAESQGTKQTVSVLPEKEDSLQVPALIGIPVKEDVSQVCAEKGSPDNEQDQKRSLEPACLFFQHRKGDRSRCQKSQGHHDFPGIQNDSSAQGDERVHSALPVGSLGLLDTLPYL